MDKPHLIHKIGDKVAYRSIASEVGIVVEGHIERRGQIWFRAFHILNYITKQVRNYFCMRLSGSGIAYYTTAFQKVFFVPNKGHIYAQ